MNDVSDPQSIVFLEQTFNKDNFLSFIPYFVDFGLVSVALDGGYLSR